MDEREHLAQADRHIARAHRLIDNQERLVGRLAAEGLDTTEARRMLATFRDTLHEMEVHRRMILDRLREHPEEG